MNPDKPQEKLNITVAGFGSVGAQVVWMLVNDSTLDCDINILEPSTGHTGKLLDILHASNLYPDKNITLNDQDLFLNADFIIHTAGGSSQIIEDRVEVLEQSVRITDSIFGENNFLNNDLRIIVVTNPVDVITCFTLKKSGLQKGRVIGTGTMLDSMRLSYYTGVQLGIPANSIRSLVLGEHGKTMVPIFDSISIRGDEISPDRINIQLLEEKTRNAAFEIKHTEQVTIYGVSACVLKLLHLMCGEGSGELMTASVPVNDHYKDLLGISKDICLGLPLTFNNGSKDYEVQKISLTDEQLTALRKSARFIESLVP